MCSLYSITDGHSATWSANFYGRRYLVFPASLPGMLILTRGWIHMHKEFIRTHGLLKLGRDETEIILL